MPTESEKLEEGWGMARVKMKSRSPHSNLFLFCVTTDSAGHPPTGLKFLIRGYQARY